MSNQATYYDCDICDGTPGMHAQHARSNQSTLNNGCVCDSGCDQCARLAEAFEAMRGALTFAFSRGLGTYCHHVTNPAKCCQDCTDARAALALADKVRQ